MAGWQPDPRYQQQPYAGQWPPQQPPQWSPQPPPPPQYRPPPKKKGIGGIVAGSILAVIVTVIVTSALASHGSPSSQAGSGAPAATSAPAQAPAAPALDKAFAGSGQYNSPSFDVSSCSNGIAVTYSYSGNGDALGASNFIAELDSSTDQQSIADDIATSGGKTTTVYPDTTFGGPASYHLSVVADGSWKFRLTCA